MTNRNFLGLEDQFYIGQFVAYPVRKLGAMWMSVGIIWENNKNGKLGIITVRLGNKEHPTLGSENYDLNLLRSGFDYCKDLICKKVWVNPYRVVPLDRNFIPSEIEEILLKELEKIRYDSTYL